MPFHPIHLAQTATARGWDKSVGTSAKDAQVINGLFEVASNPLLGTKTVYVTKRAGSSVSVSSVGSGVIALKNNNVGIDPLFVTTAGDLNNGTTSYGNITGKPSTLTNYNVADSIVNNVSVIAFAGGSSTAWFLWADAISTNFPTFTGDTHTNTTIDNIASTTGLYPGQKITGTNIAANTRIATITSATAITTTIATTGTTAGVTITKEAVAKIIDADFPTSTFTGTLVQLDGYFFACDTVGNIYQSALNDPSSWSSSNTLNADYSGDGLLFIFKIGNYIGAAGSAGTIQYFYNAGNPTGSILSPAQNLNLNSIQLFSSPLYFGGDLYFICEILLGAWNERGLYKMSGANTLTKVSDDIWSSLIGDLSLVMVSSLRTGDKHLIVPHSTSATVVPAYDPVTGMFSLIQYATALTSVGADGRNFTRASSSDVINSLGSNGWTDEGAAYTMTVQTEPQDMNNGMDASDIWIDLLADNESSGTTTLSVTDDDYANWTTVGTFDMTLTKKRINAAGQHNLRAYRIQHSANTGFRGQILRVNFEKANT